MHMGTGPLCQRHHREEPEHLPRDHEKEIRRAHECQFAGPLQLQHRRKATIGSL